MKSVGACPIFQPQAPRLSCPSCTWWMKPRSSIENDGQLAMPCLLLTAPRERERERMGKVVCVTGGSGFIASWLMKLLLERGYTVHATVRDLYDPKKTNHLYALEGANERLHLFKADLMEDGSFDAAVDGCDGVFHTASPVFYECKDPQAELIDPAVKGTLNVLGSCVKTSSVRRVVVTSSISTVFHNRRPRGPDVVIDETWYSDIEYRKERKEWYGVSKILAEEAACKFAKENNLDMVVLNPAGSFGPLLQRTLNLSSSMILNLINGSPTFPNSSIGLVDVRDVAKAHILAFEVESASGRYCLVERVLHFSDIVNILKKLVPACKFPEKCANEEPFEPTFQISKEKVRKLGLSYSPVEVSLKEAVESLKERNFIN